MPLAFGDTLANISQMLVELYQLADAKGYLIEDIAYATEHDDDYHVQEILTLRAMVYLCEGRWMDGVGTISKILKQPNVDLYTRTYALLTLGRLHVCQGDAAAPVVLDQTLALSTQADAIVRLGYTRAARAEMAWLAGNNDHAVEEARAVYDVAVNKEHPWIVDQHAFWRWRVGDNFIPPHGSQVLISYKSWEIGAGGTGVGTARISLRTSIGIDGWRPGRPVSRLGHL